MSEEHEHKGPSYLVIFATLVVLTILTVGVSQFKMGEGLGILVAMAIASVKASLVALYFMHLKTEVKPIYVVIGVPILLMLILILFLMPDVGLAGK